MPMDSTQKQIDALKAERRRLIGYTFGKVDPTLLPSVRARIAAITAEIKRLATAQGDANGHPTA